MKIGGSLGKAFESAKKTVAANPVAATVLGVPVAATAAASAQQAAQAPSGPNAEQQAQFARQREEDRAFQQQIRGRAGQIVAPQVQAGNLRQASVNVPSDFRQQQLSLAQQLSAQAQGQGPSLAQGQLRAASDRALSQQLALAAQARTPAQGALARRLAARQAGEQQQALAGQSAQLRLQEQLQAQQALAGVAGQARGQDVQTAGLETQAQQFNIQQQLQRDLANQQAALQAEQLRNQALATAAGQQAQFQNVLLGQAQLDQQAEAARQAQQSQILGGILQGGAAIGAAALSDENAKHDIMAITSDDLDEFWKAYNSVTFKYNGKDETYPGFIVQDIENTKLGADLVLKGDDGLKRYDTQKFMGILAATLKEQRNG